MSSPATVRTVVSTKFFIRMIRRFSSAFRKAEFLQNSRAERLFPPALDSICHNWAISPSGTTPPVSSAESASDAGKHEVSRSGSAPKAPRRAGQRSPRALGEFSGDFSLGAPGGGRFR